MAVTVLSRKIPASVTDDQNTGPALAAPFIGEIAQKAAAFLHPEDHGNKDKAFLQLLSHQLQTVDVYA
jgi:hypothetical protein